MKLNKDMQNALMAQAADKALPYRTLAAAVAQGVATVAAHAERTKGERKGLWATFRSALNAAHDAGHSATDLRVGLTIACNEAEVPAGTIRSYVGTLANMQADVNAGTLPLAEALELSIEKARERYPADTEAAKLKAARAEVADAVKLCTVAELKELALELRDRYAERIAAHEKAQAERKLKKAA